MIRIEKLLWITNLERSALITVIRPVVFACLVMLLLAVPPASASFGGSPGKVAFARGGAKPGIRVMKADGSGVRRLTRGNDGSPRWSPDGSRLAFIRWSDDYAVSKIVVMNADGTGKHVVSTPTREFCPVQPPSWSYDGLFIAYTSDCFDADPRVAQLRVAAADGSGEIALTDYSHWNAFTWPQPWSPDLEGSMQLVFTSDRDGDNDVYVVNSDGSDPTQLTHDDDDQFAPVWSPDGSAIVYTTQTLSPSGDPSNSLWKIAPTGGEATLLLEGQPHITGPVWSPDGTKILFDRRNRLGRPTAAIVDADGGNEVTIGKDLESADAAWSPNGRAILFVKGGDIIRYRLSDGTFKELTSSSAYDSGPDWQVRTP